MVSASRAIKVDLTEPGAVVVQTQSQRQRFAVGLSSVRHLHNFWSFTSHQHQRSGAGQRPSSGRRRASGRCFPRRAAARPASDVTAATVAEEEVVLVLIRGAGSVTIDRFRARKPTS